MKRGDGYDLHSAATEAMEGQRRAIVLALEVLAEVSRGLRQTAMELREGMNGHHAANRLDKLADLISKEEA